MGSACLTKAELNVLPDHFRPRVWGLAAGNKPSRDCM